MTDIPMPEEERQGWLQRLRKGLGRSSSKLTGGIGDLFTKRRLDDDALEDLEELLIAADLGVTSSSRLVASLAKSRFDKEVTADEVRSFLAEEIALILKPVARSLELDPSRKPHVILVCGVNGSGKTTTIGKMAKYFRRNGLSVVLAACDTFRAAAVQQLEVWGQRADCPVLTREPGADAASLAFDAMKLCQAQKMDILIIDTAGRLQNKTDLMAELEKIVRVLRKLVPQAPHDCLLVLDATVGQNAHSQVETFGEMVNVTGLVVTKLDGSAKGGVLVSLAERFKMPVHLIGVGESAEDLRPFEATAFARSLLGV